MTRSINTDEMLALQDWLKNQRKSQNLTMQNLADRMARPNSFIAKVEQGERRLDVVEYIWYCIALNIDPRVGIEVVLDHVNYPSQNQDLS